jgi:prophage DNA circulation protein
MALSNIVTAATNVAGSVGGIANSVSRLASLFGPAAGSWASALKTAQYGTVKFLYEDVETAAGRRTSIHTYPYRDEVWVEDLGKKPRQFEIRGFLVENDLVTKSQGVTAERDRLLKLCEGSAPQTLIHPTLGTQKNVTCLSLELNDRRDLGMVIEFRMSLIITGQRLYPTPTVATQQNVAANAQKSWLATALDFAKSVASAIQLGAAMVQAAVSTAVGFVQFALNVVNDVKSIVNQVSSLAGNFGRLFGGSNNGYAGSNPPGSSSATAASLLAQGTANIAAVSAAGVALTAAASNLSNSTALQTAATNLMAAVAATAADPADAIRMLSSIAQYTPPMTPAPGTIGTGMATVAASMSAMMRRTALAQIATTMTTYQPFSQQDAQTTLSNAVSLFDAEILTAADNGDDNSYMALRALRQSMILDMQSRAGSLTSIAAFNMASPLPALALANRIYRDATRADQLVTQVQPIHPAFMPASFQALAT